MLKASRLPRRKDSGGAGAETSTVPFPYQTAKGGSLPRIWVAPRSVSMRSRPKHGTGAHFFVPKPKYTTERKYYTMATVTPRTLSGFMELLPAPQQQMERMMDV